MSYLTSHSVFAEVGSMSDEVEVASYNFQHDVYNTNPDLGGYKYPNLNCNI